MKMSKNVFWMVDRLPQSLKSTLCLKKIKKTLILAFEASGALSRENETKIVKITHSELYLQSCRQYVGSMVS